MRNISSPTRSIRNSGEKWLRLIRKRDRNSLSEILRVQLSLEAISYLWHSEL